jgi:hypothetical protein
MQDTFFCTLTHYRVGHSTQTAISSSAAKTILLYKELYKSGRKLAADERSHTISFAPFVRMSVKCTANR